jgi:hypothetical protein
MENNSSPRIFSVCLPSPIAELKTKMKFMSSAHKKLPGPEADEYEIRLHLVPPIELFIHDIESIRKK